MVFGYKSKEKGRDTIEEKDGEKVNYEERHWVQAEASEIAISNL